MQLGNKRVKGIPVCGTVLQHKAKHFAYTLGCRDVFKTSSSLSNAMVLSRKFGVEKVLCQHRRGEPWGLKPRAKHPQHVQIGPTVRVGSECSLKCFQRERLV